MVNRLAVAMSGNERPYTRSDLLRRASQQNPVPAAKMSTSLFY
jgi:hypothetical protein